MVLNFVKTRECDSICHSNNNSSHQECGNLVMRDLSFKRREKILSESRPDEYSGLEYQTCFYWRDIKQFISVSSLVFRSLKITE